ncbi:MAG: GAF domain-containing protein [Acidimicrobiales bacterium]
MSLVTERGSAGSGSDRPAGPRIDDVVRVLFGGANGLAEAASEDAVCFVALETCLRAVGARGGSIRLVEQHELRLAHQLVDDLGGDGLTATLRRRDAAFDLDGSSGAALAARTGEVVAFERPEDYDGLPDSAVPDRSRSCIYVPLRLAGRAVGTIGMGFTGFVGFAPRCATRWRRSARRWPRRSSAELRLAPRSGPSPPSPCRVPAWRRCSG